MRKSLVFLGACLALSLGAAGCGDDDGAGADAGPVGVDAGPGGDAGPSDMDAGRMDAGRRVDAGPIAAECDPYTPGSCPMGQKCSVVLHGAGSDTATIAFECVPSPARPRGEGVLCGRFGFDAIDGTPAATGDTDLTDDCQQGLFCFTDAGGRFNRCQQLCGADGITCPDRNFCLTLNSEPPFGLCRRASDCDPVFQTGCAPGEGCYLIGSTTGDLLGTCFTFSAEDGGTGAPGEPCMFIDTCQPGSQCYPEILGDGGVGMDRRCRPFCATGPTMLPDAGPGTDAGPAPDAGSDAGVDAGDFDAGDVDAGTPTPTDAGVPTPDAGSDAGRTFTGMCSGALSCVSIPIEAPGMLLVPTPPGICQ